MRPIVKVLVTPNEREEEPGDNWPLMVLGSLGFNDECERVFVVTDGVRASEYSNYPEISPDEMAAICVNAINGAIKDRLEKEAG